MCLAVFARPPARGIVRRPRIHPRISLVPLLFMCAVVWSGLSVHAPFARAEEPPGGGDPDIAAPVGPGGGTPEPVPAWRALGSGLDGDVRALLLFGGDLIAAGNFTHAGNKVANHIARWDGAEWSALGGGTNGPVEALAIWDGNLVAGGSFTTAGSGNASNLARWNGSDWTPIGEGVDGAVLALAVFEGNLAVGGSFASVGGAPASNIALRSASSWSAPGPGTDGPVRALAVFDGALVAGGSFSLAGGAPAANVARWNGSSWSPLGAGTDGTVRALFVETGRLLAGGEFLQAGTAAANHVAAWDGVSWSALGSGVTGPVDAIALYDGMLTMGGLFDHAGGIPARNLALRRPSAWEIFRFGPNGEVRALAQFRAGLIVGGLFTQVAGIPASFIARYGCDVPAAPSGVAATSNLCGRVRVTWNGVVGAGGYRVFRNGTKIAEIAAGVSDFEDTGAPTGPSRYAVLAFDDCGESVLSPSATGSPRRPPGQPASLTASTDACRVVHLAWSAVPNVDHYRILRDGGVVAIAPVSQATWDDSPPPGAHAYEVQAGTSCGWSASAAASGSALQPPDPPSGVVASDTSCSIVRIDWAAVPGVARYRLTRDGEPLVTLPAAVLHHEDAPTPGAYQYAVSAEGECGWSAVAVDSGAVARAPDPPPSFAASDTSCSVIRLAWVPSAGVTGYRVTRDGALLATLPAGASSLSDTVAPGTYAYGLAAANACGWSSEKIDPGSLLPVSPPAPPFFEASTGRCFMIQLAWGASPGASGYEVHRDGALLASLPASELSCSDSAASGTHRYTLRARSTCGVSDSLAATGFVLPADPGPPAEVSASDSICAVVHLRWGAPGGSDSVRILRDGEPLVTLPADLSFYADSVPSGAHVYSISARGACGWGAPAVDTGSVLLPPPGLVAELSASQGLCSVVRLSWSAAPRAERYYVHRDFARIATLPASELSFEDSTVGSHLYWVSAANRCSGTQGMLIPDVRGFANGPPSPPTGFTASDTSCSVVRLDWKASSAADTLLLFRDGALLATLKPGEDGFEDRAYTGEHVYEIELVNACGRSARARATGAVLPGSPVPPTALAATADRCDSVVVKWKDLAADEISFDVLRDGESLDLLPANTERYVDRPAPGHHEYEVRAVGTCAVTSAGRVPGRRLPPPSPPALFWPPDGGSVPGGSPIVLLWYPGSGSTGCHVQAAASGDPSGALVDTLLGAETDSLVFSYLPPGEYAWRVATVAPCGEGEYSATRMFTREAIGAFDLSNRAVAFGYDPLGGPAGGSPPDPEPDPVIVRNEGEVGFAWDADPSDPWIRIEPDSGFLASGESETLLVAVFANQLLSGQFDGRVFVRTDLASRPVDTVNVDLSVIQYPLGDCNGNGNLDERDIAALVDHLLEDPPLWSPILRLGLADVDRDDSVGSVDLDRLPSLIGSSLLSERPDAEENPGEEGVLWVGMSTDSFVVSLEGTGDVRAGAVRLRLAEGSGSPTIHVSPIARSLGAAAVQRGRDLVLLFDFTDGDPRILDGGTRIDLVTLTWDGADEPSMEFAWGGVAPSGSERFPITRAEWYRIGGPGSRRFAFFPIRPNPFTSECLIAFELPSALPVSLRVFDPAGRLVRTIVSGDHAPGFHTYTWDGRDGAGRRVGLGTYFVRLESPRGDITRRSVVVR